jgi:hypothetical protein
MAIQPLPFERSYWVEPGRFLAGAYPGDSEPAEARQKLAGLIRCGVGLVINLMQTNEVNNRGERFVDYRPVLESLGQAAGNVVDCRRMPIRDMDVPTVRQMGEILDSIDEAKAVAYVHCWGGKGRTGTVVGCYLARHGRAVGEEALARLNALTKGSPYDFGYVPQTAVQCEFVRSWKRGQ